MGDRLVVSLGENAVFEKGLEYTEKGEVEALKNAAKTVAGLIKEGYDVTVVFGCENYTDRVVCGKDVNYSLIDCIKEAQKAYGEKFCEYLNALLEKTDDEKRAKYVEVNVLVDAKDRAFRSPSVFIGNAYQRSDAKKIARLRSYKVKEAPGGGFRRILSSPVPRDVLNTEVLSDFDTAVLVCGGGIPFTADGKTIDCVVEKDLTAGLVADILEAQCLLNLTDIEYAYTGFIGSKKAPIRRMTYDEAERHFIHGEFLIGTMLPKVEAGMRFVRDNGKRRAIISTLEKASDAMHLKTGTIIVFR